MCRFSCRKTWSGTSSANSHRRGLSRVIWVTASHRIIAMETSAKLRFARISPQKARLVADQIRGMSVEAALETLRFSTKKAARIVHKLLESAVANAEHNEGADIDELRVATITVDEGPSIKRIKPRARGSADRILKRTSHVTIRVADRSEEHTSE